MTRAKRRAGGTSGLLSLEQLERWLDDLDPPAPGVSMIDGFLAALVVSPRFVHPDVWMRHIIGDRARYAPEGSMAAAASRTIINRYNEISTALGEHPESYAPIYMRTDDGEVLLEEWANGFFGAMRLALDAWVPFVTDPETAYPLTLILGHSTRKAGAPSLIDQLADKSAADVLADSWRVIPEVVSLLRDRCADARKVTTA